MHAWRTSPVRSLGDAYHVRVARLPRFVCGDAIRESRTSGAPPSVGMTRIAGLRVRAERGDPGFVRDSRT